MPETFRREKIEDFIRRLQVRKDILQKQLEQQEFQDQQPYIKGQIYAVDTSRDGGGIHQWFIWAYDERSP